MHTIGPMQRTDHGNKHNPISSSNTGVFYLTIVRCTIHTPTVQRITLRCVHATELTQHHKEYPYLLARRPQVDSSSIQIIQSDVLPQLSRYTRPLSRTPYLGAVLSARPKICIYKRNDSDFYFVSLEPSAKVEVNVKIVSRQSLC